MAFGEAKARGLEALRAALSGDEPLSAHVAAVQRAVAPAEPGADETDAGASSGSGDKLSKEMLELIVRMFMEELLAHSKRPGESVESVGIPRLLDLAIELASAEAVDTCMPFALLEDLFETQVISDAEKLFGLVEKRAASLAPCLGLEQKYQRGRLTLIRTCNELLHRLSKSKNTNFCGRIHLFMSYALPLAEKSGLNLRVCSGCIL